MGRMMLGSLSSYLSSLHQHRKSQYTGNVIGGANEEPFPQKSCSYTQYNLLPPNKTEGELTLVKLLQKSTINISVPAAVELSCSWWHIWWLRASQSVSKSNRHNYTTTVRDSQIAFCFPLSGNSWALDKIMSDFIKVPSNGELKKKLSPIMFDNAISPLQPLLLSAITVQ